MSLILLPQTKYVRTRNILGYPIITGDLIKLKLNSVARELYRPSDRRLSTKLVPTFADSGCHVVSATDLYGR
jgi:hypothetical protein